MKISSILASSNKNNFNSVHHRTKEAEIKVNELYCYNCDMLDTEDCLNINNTKTSQVNFNKKCSEKESFCSVKRFSYTMYNTTSDTTSEKKLWTLQRGCKEKCENACIIIGERVKIHACETCCTTNLCNVGSHACKVHFNSIASIFIFFVVSLSSNFS